MEEIGSESEKEIAKLCGEQVGCLEVINHGISQDFVKFVLDLGGGVFQISPEKKISVVRSHDKRYGYEEIHGQGEFNSSVEDKDEEFVWSCGDEGMKVQMVGIWPSGYSNFRYYIYVILVTMNSETKCALVVGVLNLCGVRFIHS